MDRVIVTIWWKGSKKRDYDLELPIDQKLGDLMTDITQTLETCEPDLCFFASGLTMTSLRTGKNLDMGKTLEELHIYNGDILKMSYNHK